MNLYGFVKNNAINRIDLWGLKCSLVSGPTVTGTDWIVRELDFQTSAATYSALIDGVTVTWGLEGEVKCCCDFLVVFKRNVTKTVYKTVTASLPQNTFPIVAFAPGNAPGRPSFTSILNGIGKVLGGGAKKILGNWAGYYVTDYDAGLLTSGIENTKPASLSDGDWPDDPCN